MAGSATLMFAQMFAMASLNRPTSPELDESDGLRVDDQHAATRLRKAVSRFDGDPKAPGAVAGSASHMYWKRKMPLGRGNNRKKHRASSSDEDDLPPEVDEEHREDGQLDGTDKRLNGEEGEPHYPATGLLATCSDKKSNRVATARPAKTGGPAMCCCYLRTRDNGCYRFSQMTK